MFEGLDSWVSGTLPLDLLSHDSWDNDLVRCYLQEVHEPALASRIKGEALTAGRSVTLKLPFQISEVDYKGILLFPIQCSKEIGSVESGDLGRPLLGNLTALVPMYCSSKPHLSRELLR